MKKQALQDRLIEEGFSEVEASAAESTVNELLPQAPHPRVRPMHQAQVLRAMTALLPRPKTRLERLREWYPLALLISQAWVLRRAIWLASALVLAIGLLATLASPPATPGAEGLLFPMLAPLVAAVGIAVLYDESARAMLEIENSTPAPGPLLLLARLTLVFAFNLGLGLACSAALALLRGELAFAPLVMSWLAPMTFLCGLSFFLGIATADPLLAAGSSLLLWMVHLLVRQANTAGSWLSLAAMPGLSDPSFRPLLMLSAALLVAAALWLLQMRETHLRYTP